MRIVLLGGFQIELSGEVASSIPSRRRRALLAYLAMHPAFSDTRERLATFLWGDVPDRQSRQSLRQALVSLRTDLAPQNNSLLNIERDKITIVVSESEVDARQLLFLSKSKRSSDILKAAKLYKGPFLDGINVDTENFNCWLLEQRSQVETAARIVLSQAALDPEVAGAEAALFAERLLSIDPTRTASQKIVLAVFAKHYGRDRALAEAQRIDRMLVAEYGLGLHGEVRAIVTELNREHASAESPEERRVSTDHSKPTATPIAPNAVVSSATPPSGNPTMKGRMIVAPIGAAVLLVFGAFVLSRTEKRDPVSEVQAPTINPAVTAATVNLASLGLYPIVVLPFTSGDTSEDEVKAAELFTDDLINDLSTVNAFRVISRSTSHLYKNRKIDIATIGVELGVRYVVSGSVKIDNGVAQIDAELIDATSRLDLWSQRFEQPTDKLAGVRRDILHSIARQLQVSVYMAEDAKVRPKPDQDLTLEELLRKGWASMTRFPSDLSENPAAYFKQALKLHPDNESALLGYAGSQIVPATSLLGRGREFELAEAERDLGNVLARNPYHATGLLYRGMLKRLQGDQTGARDDFLLSIEHHPSFATAYAQAGYSMYRLGEFDKGMEYVLYAIRLSPRDPGLGVWDYFAGLIELERGNDAAAFDWLDRSVNLVPRNVYARLALAASLAQRGEVEAATNQVKELSHIAPWITLDSVMTLSIGSPPPGSHGRLIAGVEKAFRAVK